MRVTSLPKCDFCGEPAAYDAPTVVGPWANMCRGCAEQNGGNLSIGSSFELVAPVAKENEGKEVQGIERSDIEYLEGVVYGDENREPECPLCGSVRALEIDATYFHCDCGAKVIVDGFPC